MGLLMPEFPRRDHGKHKQCQEDGKDQQITKDLPDPASLVHGHRCGQNSMWFASGSGSVAAVSNDALRQRLREAISAAMKERDRVAVTALRSTLAAIDNAEAVDTTASAAGSLTIKSSPVVRAGVSEGDHERSEGAYGRKG
jgi:hypothetical protein